MISCRKDDGVADPQPSPESISAWTAAIVNDLDIDDPSLLACREGYESIQVTIKGRTDQTRAVIVATDSDWLSVKGDTLAKDSIVVLSTTNNYGTSRREATIKFSDADNPQCCASITLTQLSPSDNDSNDGDARSQFYVGYGYNIYTALESPMAVRTVAPILDINFLLNRNNEVRYNVIQDCRLMRTEVRYVASNNIHAHGENLVELQTGNSEDRIEGCLQNCLAVTEAHDNANGTLEHQNFGHGSLEKAVASRVIDKAALLDLKSRNEMPFTRQYLQCVWQIRHSSGAKRQQLIEQLLVKYGTHVVIQADLGGRIDYTFTMKKTSSFNTRQEMLEEVQYTLGRISGSDRKGSNKTVSSSKSHKGAITVRGGSAQTRQVLDSDINGLYGGNANGQLDPAHITDWLASINYSSNPANDPNIDVIHFELIPVWDIVGDDLRREFLNATLQMVNRSDCALPSSFLGTDIYEFEPKKNAALFSFDDAGEHSTLCRLHYCGSNANNQEPVLQVCSEYVPNIRTDARVTIVYPIYKQHIRMNQGLFLGDGVHQPAYVGFSGSNCYVDPIPDLAAGSYIEKFWYVNGSLSLLNPTDIDGLKARRQTTTDEYLWFFADDDSGAKTYAHPLVKVGSQIWTRHDIDHRMLFAESFSGGSLDQMNDGVLYTMFQWDVNSEFDAYNGWLWGYKPNVYYASTPNTKWYLPTANDVKNLYEYLGFNPKSLFKGELSGWDAEFNGYYGNCDLLNKNRYFSGRQREMRYKGTLNVICSKNTDDTDDACILVIDTDYHLTLIDDKTFTGGYSTFWRSNFYPVRPVRGFMYEYPLLKTVNNNLR